MLIKNILSTDKMLHDDDKNNNNNSILGNDMTTCLFSSLISKLFDQIYKRIEPILRQGISTLPLLSSNHAGNITTTALMQQQEQDSIFSYLFRLLHTSYTENIDLVEQYAIRNIFTLPMNQSRSPPPPAAAAAAAASSSVTAASSSVTYFPYTKRQQMELVRRFLERNHYTKDIQDKKTNEDENHQQKEQDQQQEQQPASIITKEMTGISKCAGIPTSSSSLSDCINFKSTITISPSSSIPTVDEMEQLQVQLHNIRTQLRKAFLLRNTLKQQVIQIHTYSTETLSFVEDVFTETTITSMNSTSNHTGKIIPEMIFNEQIKLQSLIIKAKEQLNQLQQICILRGDIDDENLKGKEEEEDLNNDNNEKKKKNIWSSEETIELSHEMKQAAIHAYNYHQTHQEEKEEMEPKKRKIFELNVEEEYLLRRQEERNKAGET